MEECAEVSHIASKQIQFGKDSDNNGKYEKTNSQRLLEEIIDFMVVAYMLENEGEIEVFYDDNLKEAYKKKSAKMQKYLNVSVKLGKLPEIKL